MILALLKINKEKRNWFLRVLNVRRFYPQRFFAWNKRSKSSIGGLRSEEQIIWRILIIFQGRRHDLFILDGYVDSVRGTKTRNSPPKDWREYAGIYQLPVTEQKERIEKHSQTGKVKMSRRMICLWSEFVSEKRKRKKPDSFILLWKLLHVVSCQSPFIMIRSPQ